MKRSILIALAALLLATVGATAADDPKPFPVDRTQILKNGGSYFVEGRVRIAKGVQIMVQKETKIVGRGDAGGIIEVEGQFALVGVSNLHVILQDVTIELQPTFTDFRTDMVDFTGKSAGVVSPPDKTVDGRLFLQNTTFEGKSTVDVTMSSSEIDLQRVDAPNLVHVKAVDPPGQTGNRVKLTLMNNCGASHGAVSGQLAGGLLVERVNDVIVRCNVLGGDKVTFSDCGAVAFDTNHVTCKTVEFLESVAGRFGKTWISKCDVQCGKIVLTAPFDPKKPDFVPCDKCWFGGETSEKAVHEKFFADHEKNADSGVTVKLTAIEAKALQLAGNVTR